MRAFAEAGATDFAPVELIIDPDDAATTRDALLGGGADQRRVTAISRLSPPSSLSTSR